MPKIKVNINKPDPGPETIRKYKNYNGFLKQYQDLHTPNGIYRMWKKDPVKMSMIIVFLALLLIFFFSDWEKKPQEELKKENQQEETSFLFDSEYSFYKL